MFKKDDSIYKANNNLSFQDKKIVLEYYKKLKKEERARNKKETEPKEKKERQKRTNKPKKLNPKPKKNLFDDNIFYRIALGFPNLGFTNNIIHNTQFEPEDVANPLNKDFYNNFKEEDPN